jgi:hypothetical protein
MEAHVSMEIKDGIEEALLEGASLRSVMVPDPDIPTNRPVHVETYFLPHVISKDGLFWAFHETSHLVHVFGQPASLIKTTFSYTNHGPLFCSFSEESSMVSVVVLMSKLRYREHYFLTPKTKKIIWDSENATTTISVRQAVERGARLSIALLDSENVWNMHPVDLPMSHLEDDAFELKTTFHTYPLFFRSKEFCAELIKNNENFFLTKPHDNQDGCLGKAVSVFPSFYVVYSNFEYYNFFDVPRGTKQRYLRLKVFEDL